MFIHGISAPSNAFGMIAQVSGEQQPRNVNQLQISSFDDEAQRDAMLRSMASRL